MCAGRHTAFGCTALWGVLTKRSEHVEAELIWEDVMTFSIPVIPWRSQHAAWCRHGRHLRWQVLGLRSSRGSTKFEAAGTRALVLEGVSVDNGANGSGSAIDKDVVNCQVTQGKKQDIHEQGT